MFYGGIENLTWNFIELWIHHVKMFGKFIKLFLSLKNMWF